MIKRLLLVICILFALALVALVAGSAWFIARINSHMTPPPDPAGQPSIAVTAAAAAPRQTARVLPPAPPLFDWATIDDPPAAARPWTRWWWPGGAVELPSLEQQLEQLYGAGFGGVEVQPFAAGMTNVAGDDDLMARVHSFDSPGYYQSLGGAIAHARDLGMQVDLTNFSGWPPGGPQVNLEDSPTIMAYGEATVSGGQPVSLALPRPKPGPAEYMFAPLELTGTDFMNFPAEHARLVSVVAARASGEHRRNPYYLADTVSLDPDSLQVLTGQVADGRLHWDAPAGEWRIVASYLLPSGEVPMVAAQKPQGFVVDHLREAQVVGQYAHAFGEATGLPAHYGRGLRGIFNDSLEFRLRRMAAPDILAEFRARRGYDLEPWLPALYIEGVDNMYFRDIMSIYAAPEFRLTDLDDRIRHDYQQTLSDLVIERFVETSERWARERGLASRGQSYGMDMDLIRGLGANSIPETEQLWAGGASVGLKFASSAAALYGRPLVSAESFVWINRDYMPAARRIKAAADKLFLNGINHVIYHGTPYPWRGDKAGDYGDEGWAPFSGPANPAHFSGNFSAANPALWPDLPALNRYIARSQNLLRQGRPDVDVLVYYPFLGFHGSNRATDGEVLISGALPDADPPSVLLEGGPLAAARKLLDRVVTTPAHVDPRVAWVEQLQPLLLRLERAGISWAWVNDHALQSGRAQGGVFTASGGNYRALLLPDVEALDPATLPALQRHLQDGVPVIFAGELPGRQRSFLDAGSGDAAVRAGVAALLTAGAVHSAAGEELFQQLSQVASTAMRYRAPSTIQRYRRELEEGGAIQFFANQSPEAATLALAVAPEAPLWWFDAQSGRAWPAQVVDGELQLALAGFDSRFLLHGVPLPGNLASGEPAGAAIAGAQPSQLLTDWEFVLGEYRSRGALFDWRDVDAVRYAHGPGVYRHTLTLAAATPGQHHVLDLGLVQGSAQVLVNGRELGHASLPPFALDISPALQAGDNTVEVRVLAPLRNRMVGRALAGDPLYDNMLEFEHELVAAGLIGPVALYQVAALRSD